MSIYGYLITLNNHEIERKYIKETKKLAIKPQTNPNLCGTKTCKTHTHTSQANSAVHPSGVGK